jgi:hypothetical protein
VKYLILIWSNPDSQQIWQGLSDEQKSEGLGYYAEFTRGLADSGELVVTEALAEPSAAKRVAVREGQVTTTDGPFAEVKEHLAGFYLVDCETLERALEIAAGIPEAAFGLVEVRPTRQLSDFLSTE